MKKKFVYLCCVVMSVFSLTSCDNDDDNGGGVEGASGVGCYILNQGNWGGNDASLQYYSFENSTATSPVCSEDIFFEQNALLLGDVAQDLLWIKDKLFVTVSTSQKTEVLDENGKRIQEPYKYTETMACPRMIATDGNNVYITNYDKNIYVYNASTAKFVKTIPVGSYPEGISYVDGYLVVNNSDYGACDGDASVSIIDLNNGVQQVVKDHIYNPGTQSVVCNGDVYIVDAGNYYDVSSNVLRISPEEGTVESLGIQAYLLAAYENYLYYVDASWSYTAGGYEYSPLYRRDVVTGEVIEVLPVSSVKNIYSLSVNPENGDIFVGYTNGSDLGTMRVYAADGTQKGVFGVGYFTVGAKFEN